MSYKRFSNRACTHYPCHKNVKNMNCLFCYCPLYHMDCGGNFTTLANGKKDCSSCIKPHTVDGYDMVVSKLTE